MRVRMILPALTVATSPFFRPIKYSLFPLMGLATLAGYLSDEDEVSVSDEHVERLSLDDKPDLVVIQAYITSARRAYEIADLYRARGSHAALGGLHVYQYTLGHNETHGSSTLNIDSDCMIGNVQGATSTGDSIERAGEGPGIGEDGPCG